jgi:hypothetical protein
VKNLIYKIVNFIKAEKFSFLVILFIYILLIFITWPKYGELISFDNTREMAVPYFILNGLMIYTDFNYFYGVLPPYILAGFIFLLGVKLSSFYIAGLLFVLLISITLYNLSRQVMGQIGSSFVVILFLIQLAFFNNGIFSYVLPYSYASVMGILVILLLSICLIKKIKEPDNNSYLWFATFICALSFLIKQETATACLASFTAYYLITGLNHLPTEKPGSLTAKLKNYFSSLAYRSYFKFMLIIFALPLLVYFLIGLKTGFSTLFTSLIPLDLFQDPAVQIFVRETLHGSFSLQNLLELLQYGLIIPLIALFFISLVTFILWFNSPIHSRKLLLTVTITIIIFLLLFLIPFQNQPLLLVLAKSLILQSKYIYSGANLWIIAFLIYTLTKFRNTENQILALLSFICLFTGYRTFYNMQLDLYAPYYLPVYLVVIVYLLISFIPASLQNLKITVLQNWKTATNVMIVLIILLYTTILYGTYTIKSSQIPTDIGVFYTKPDLKGYYIPMLKATDYINKHKAKGDKTLFYPNSNVSYLLTETLPGSYYYYIVPATIFSIEQEQKAIEEIQKNAPRYIVISNETYIDYGIKDFGSSSFVPDLYQYILDHYHPVFCVSTSSKQYPDYNVKIYEIHKQKNIHH